MPANEQRTTKIRFGKIISFVTGMAMGGALTSFVAYSIVGEGKTYAEMDWNNDGETSLGEMLNTFNVGVRSVEVNGCPCRFFFEYKDGRSVRTMCDGKIVDFDPYAPAN